ncbi:UNVERIFIED_CONTAM: hypothetical protein Slati_1159700 [Sesamum latifolium]|uniref:Endonuclease/exonuclease/phosphatase domain-containing protein n=1 Tax=Sesamum latifolium TaxID=2727402 RepID=A0AAW2XG14_9LAMI
MLRKSGWSAPGLQSYSVHHIDAFIQVEGLPEGWRFTGFYSHPEVAKRRATWNLLRQLSHHSSRAWICAGNYNEILLVHEKEGVIPQAQGQIEEFRKCLEDCEMQDMGFKGFPLTWWNRREAPHTVKARLDRACCNPKWAVLFPEACVLYEQTAASDHLLVWVDLEPSKESDKKKRKNSSDLKQHG